LERSTTTIGRLRGKASRVFLLWLTAAIPLGHDVSGQELEALDGDVAVSTDPFISDAATGGSILGDSIASGSYLTASGFPEEGVPTVRPVNWISGPYLRGGVNFVMSRDLFDAEQGTGYGISGGWRQPLGPEIGGDRFFFDLGGSFQDSYGRSTPKATPGRVLTTTILGPVETVDPNAFQNTLEEVRRGSVHAALGWFWGSGFDNRGWDPQLRIATRLGGRVGHARGGFTEEQIDFPNPMLNQTAIDRAHFADTDTYGGLFVATEAILLQRQFSLGQFQWTVDGEFANDWIDFAGRWEGSLGTASVMMGFMLSR
jgi:hypothetical protein